MGMIREYRRHSRHVTKSRRWKALRMQALDRDGWACVQCGTRLGLEVDHVLPVRDRPDLSFSLGNLQSLCGRCHARKTRLECGHTPLPPQRQEWRDLLRVQLNPIEHEE